MCNCYQRIKLCLRGDSISEKENTINNEQYYNNYISYKLEKTDQKFECVICLENICNSEYVSLTTCFHMYHTNCLNDWLKISSVCPLCEFKLY